MNESRDTYEQVIWKELLPGTNSVAMTRLAAPG